MRRFLCLAVALLLVCSTPALAQDAVPASTPYTATVKALDAFIARQVEERKLPALSIALVDDQKIVWASGFGFADPKRRSRPRAETVYRVGSVSKLFTDLAVMQLVEQRQARSRRPRHQIPARLQAEQPLRQGDHAAAADVAPLPAWCASRRSATTSIPTEPSLAKRSRA